MDDAATIRATGGPWQRACLDRDWDALLDLCTSDFVFAPPDQPAVAGAQVRPWLETFPVMKVFDFAFDSVEVSGNLATAVGRGTYTLVVNGQDMTARFKFADVFKKGPDGRWRYVHVIWNHDAPAA